MLADTFDPCQSESGLSIPVLSVFVVLVTRTVDSLIQTPDFVSPLPGLQTCASVTRAESQQQAKVSHTSYRWMFDCVRVVPV